MIDEAEHILHRTERNFVIGCGVGTLIVATVAWLVGTVVLVPTAASIAFTLVALIGWRMKDPLRRRTLLLLGAVGQAIGLTAALSGHPWQIDSHMVFFALLAVGIRLIEVRAILFAAAMIAVHHVVLSVAMPTLLYPGAEMSENIARALFHGVVVIAETAVLVLAVRNRLTMVASLEEQLGKVKHVSAEAETARRHAEGIAAEAEQRRQAADRMAKDAEDLRQHAEETARSAAEANDRALAASRDLAEERTAQGERQARVVSALKDALHRLSRGDLTVRLPRLEGEEYAALSDDFNGAIAQLSEAITLALGSSADITAQIGEINSATENLSGRTEQQAHSIADAAAAIHQLTASVQSAVTVASDAATAAVETDRLARQSSNVVAESIQAMNQIEQSSHQIARITGVIDDIAFQTNLLALNAGVEAARAGEAGRGFAVVASEVRDLAQRSSASAREISELIGASERQVKTGVELVNRMVTALDKIIGSVEKISARVTEIARTTDEQSRALSEINGSVEQLDHVTQQNVAMFEETTAASRTLNDMAHRLREVMITFQTESGEGLEAWRRTG